MCDCRLDGHRGYWAQAIWGWNDWSAIDEAYGHIEGVSPDRSKSCIPLYLGLAEILAVLIECRRHENWRTLLVSRGLCLVGILWRSLVHRVSFVFLNCLSHFANHDSSAGATPSSGERNVLLPCEAVESFPST